MVKPSYNIAKIIDQFVGANHPCYGKVVAQEVRDKISKALTGRTLTTLEIENHLKGARKKVVYCYDVTTKKLVTTFESMRALSRQMNINRGILYRTIDKNKPIYVKFQDKECAWLLYYKPI